MPGTSSIPKLPPIFQCQAAHAPQGQCPVQCQEETKENNALDALRWELMRQKATNKRLRARLTGLRESLALCMESKELKDGKLDKFEKMRVIIKLANIDRNEGKDLVTLAAILNCPHRDAESVKAFIKANGRSLVVKYGLHPDLWPGEDRALLDIVLAASKNFNVLRG